MLYLDNMLIKEKHTFKILQFMIIFYSPSCSYTYIT
jgi:hypothetical protein